MNKSESKYFNTGVRMDKALLQLLEKKDFEYITVKEICALAGVNRSTFYLHYETISDLLSECISRVMEQFCSSITETPENFMETVRNAPLEQLYLITPKYLLPYLSYVQSHKAIFKLFLSKPNVFGADKIYHDFIGPVLNQILERHNIPVDNRKYILSFCVEGLMGIVKRWLMLDCSDSAETIANIMMMLINPNQREENIKQ